MLGNDARERFGFFCGPLTSATKLSQRLERSLWGLPSSGHVTVLARDGRFRRRNILPEYATSTFAELEMVCAACQSLSRAESMREVIDKDGECIPLRE
jgi:hypothetical protein